MRLFSVLSFLLGATVLVEGQPTEREVLIVTYSHLGGNSWTNKYGWEEGLDNVCEWYGVTCEGETDSSRRNERDRERGLQFEGELPGVSGQARIIAIDLSDNGLRGRLHPSFWRLPKLQKVNFNDNDEMAVSFDQPSASLTELRMHSTATETLSGIDTFTRLSSLHLSGVQLGGIELPDELFKLTNLQELHMAQCELVGSIPSQVQAWSNLKQLNLYDNDMQGTIPLWIGEKLPRLTELVLSRNRFVGAVPTSLESLSDLQELYLDHNQLTGRMLAFANTPLLHKYHLESNKLTGSIPSDLIRSYKGTSKQIRISLDDNNLGSDTNLIPSALDSLREFPVKLTVSDNMFNGFQDSSLCDNTNWQDDTEMADYGCDAIACPIGTFNAFGRRTTHIPCLECDTAAMLGQTACMDGDDRAVLQEMYLATDGDNWKRNDGWMKTRDICEWWGVHCWDAEQYPDRADQVQKLILDNNNLVGTTPPALFALEEMTELRLSRNPSLTFSMDGIGKSRYLHVLNIAHTNTFKFKGIEEAQNFFTVLIADELPLQGSTLPMEIGELTKLNILSMNQCGMTGNLRIGKLTGLSELYLWGNDFRGQLPDELGGMKDLRILSLAKNRFTGTLPDSFEQLDQLEALSLKDQVTKGGGITGELLSFQSSPQLTNLMLSQNKLEGSIPSHLLDTVDRESVVTVDVASNVLTGVIPGELTSFTNMNLYAQNNLITSIDDSLCKNNGWQGGLVGDYGCEAILCPEYTVSAGIGRREYDHQVCGACADPNAKPILGQTLCGAKDEVLTERELLQLLYDSCNGAQWIRKEKWGAAEEHICSWQGIDCDHAKSVVSIVLGMNNLKCDIPSQLWTLPNLERLNVLGNDVSLDFSGIDKATHLRELVLESTSIRHINGIGFARGLVELNVNDNRLGGTLPNELSRLVGLVTLDVSHNSFEGFLPHWLEHLPKLERFYADWNQFEGTLPSFSELGELKLLNISSNMLTGSLPTDFLKGLADGNGRISVDVSNNQLTGTVPAQWSYSVPHLHLDVSNNKLTGANRTLCSEKLWNGNDVDEFGCDGILCPVGTFNAKGRQTAHSNPCKECSANLYAGATTCSSARMGRIVAFSGFFILTSVTVLLSLM